MVNKTKIDNGTASYEHVMTAGNKAAETFAKATAEAAKGYEQFFAASKENVEAAVKAGAEAFKGYEGVAGFGKENVEAVVRTSSVIAKGFETLGARFAELAKASVEESMAASKALMGCRTVKDMMDVQGTIARNQFGKIVSESAAITEIGTKVASEAFAPIASQFSATFEKFTKTAA